MRHKYYASRGRLNGAQVDKRCHEKRSLVKVGDSVVAIHGVREEVSGSSNLLKIIEVS
jgi:hypothetical protein